MITSKVNNTVFYIWYDFWQIQGSKYISSYMFFKSGPWTVLFILGCYLWFIKVYGPKLMKDREPLKLRKVLVIYNCALVYVSAYVFIKGSLVSNYGLDAWTCQKEVYDLELFPNTQAYIFLTWIYFCSKLVELADTVFFVFRKKQRQITTLHIIHHTTVPISAWIGIKFTPNPLYSFFPWINSGIHILMYLYYGMTALAPTLNLTKCKKCLTLLQIGQFIFAIVHSLFLIVNPKCPFPTSTAINTFANAFLFLALFVSYYRKSYKVIKSKVNGQFDTISAINHNDRENNNTKQIKVN